MIRESSSFPRELYASVVQLVGNAQRYYYTVYDWVIHLLENNPEFAAKASEVINEYYTDALAWINVNLVPQLQVAAHIWKASARGGGE